MTAIPNTNNGKSTSTSKMQDFSKFTKQLEDALQREVQRREQLNR